MCLCVRAQIYIYIYPRGPRFSDDRTPVVAPLQMITLYHAPRQGRVGWGVGLSFVECWSRCWCSRCRWSRCIMLRDRGGVGWGVGWRVGWGGVYYRLWNVDHVVDAPLQMITLYHAPRQGGVGLGGGVGWGVLSFVECWSRCWCSAADDHVVSCTKEKKQKTCWLSGFLTFKQHSNVVQIPCKIRLPLFCLWKHRVKWDVSTYVAYHRNVSVLYL